MIYNKVGETLEFEGKKYAVGENIVGAETSEYEGLFGYIKEIRTDNDKASRLGILEFLIKLPVGKRIAVLLQ